MTVVEGYVLNCFHAKTTSSRSCGGVGRDREARELLDLLNAPSSVECVFPPFALILFLSFLLARTQKCSGSAGDCACRISLVFRPSLI